MWRRTNLKCVFIVGWLYAHTCRYSYLRHGEDIECNNSDNKKIVFGIIGGEKNMVKLKSNRNNFLCESLNSRSGWILRHWIFVKKKKKAFIKRSLVFLRYQRFNETRLIIFKQFFDKRSIFLGVFIRMSVSLFHDLYWIEILTVHNASAFFKAIWRQ